ncbi:MAG: GGDEF domain-containing protein [Campylobacterota bacterium]|nr:GGDEF domain-containing protein [Campylobacterota bacterium]
MINTFLIGGLVAFVSLFFLNYFYRENLSIAILDFVSGITFLSTFIDLRINKKEKRSIFIMTFSLTLFIFYFVWLNHDSNFGLIWTIFVPILAITLYGYKIGGYLSLVYYILMFSLVIYGLEAWESEEWDIVALIRFLVSSVVLLFVLYITEYSFSKMQDSLNMQTLTDPLTQLYNRRKIDETIKKSIETIQRNPSPLSLVIMDIDDFKSVNDTYGHLVGDEVLKALANILQKNIRNIDTLGRWGGEEFIIVLPHTPLEDAILSIERLQQEINTFNFKTVGQITCSYGLCSANTSEYKDQELITCADDALYEAKNSGKDKICTSILS